MQSTIKDIHSSGKFGDFLKESIKEASTLSARLECPCFPEIRFVHFN
jgi:hypothetical protein